MAGREKNKGVDKKAGGTQDNGLGFCEKEIFMPFECVPMRVWGCTALLIAGLMCVPEARAWEAVTDGLPEQTVAAVDKSRQRFSSWRRGNPAIICVQPGRCRATNRYAAI